MAFDRELQQETEFQRRKVAALERYIAQMDLDRKVMEEVHLAWQRNHKDYEVRLAEERQYLAWLEGGAKYEDAPEERSDLLE
jgi:uncharacterized membrane protein YidH (DUF202 family)